ncbi:MAG TPA: endonuclease/exonuclease/phosphatase family protein [Candidatus Nanoarchaeia archaeon]|nr:endonuclease/exonuclease/phosphatase family protein [Candidatus Nanoarchaeia archaeon]
MEQLKIITFNIWDLPLWFNKERRARVAKIAEYLKAHNADIICLQETWDAENQRFLIERMGPDYYCAFGAGRSQKYWLKNFSNFCGGLMIFSKFPIQSEDFFPFPRLNYSLTEMCGHKGFLSAVVATPWGNLRVIDTHLHSWTFWGKKFRLTQLRKIMRQVGENDLPVVLCGDFNQHDILGNEPFAKLLAENNFHLPAGADALYSVPTYRRENPFVDMWPNRVPFSHRLDYIFTRGQDRLGLAVKDHRPIILDPPLSDHDPVEMILESSEK